jgi:21S rRNA (uridine2791-2'-O)-methyltransferase
MILSIHQFQIRLFGTSIIRLKSASSNRWLNRQTNDYFTRRAKEENLKSRAAFKLLQIDEKFNIFGKSKNTSNKLTSKTNNRSKSLNVLDLGAAPGAWNQVSLDRCPHGSKVLGVDILPYQPPHGASTIQGNILSKGTHKLIQDFFQLSELEKKNKAFENVEIISKTGFKNIETTIESDVSIVERETELNKIIESKKSSDTQNAETDLKTLYPVDVILSDMYVPFPRTTGFSSATTNNPYLRMANTTGLAFKDHTMSMDLCDAALITAVDLLKKNGSLVMKFFTGEEDKILERRLQKVFREVKRFKPKACRLESKECYFVCLGKKDYSFDKLELFTTV